MKKRVSLTLDEASLDRLDRDVDGVFVRSRSDAVDKLIKDKYREDRVAVVLAGGRPEGLVVEGTRTYRPLADVGGRPVIDDVLAKCGRAGFKEVLFVGSSKVNSAVRDAVGERRRGVRVTYVEDDRYLGTAKTLELVRGMIKNDFLFLPCDSFFNFDLDSMWGFHRRMEGVATVGVHIRRSYKWDRGIVDMKGYRITEYTEKPRSPKTNIASAFIGVMSPRVLDAIPSGNVRCSLQEDVFPQLAKRGELIAYPLEGDWVNIHTQGDVRSANRLVKTRK